MANILTTIKTAFYDYLLTGADDFMEAIEQIISLTTYHNLYNHQAPINVTETNTPVELPYIVFDLLPISTSRDSASKMFDVIIQFRIVAETILEADNLSGFLIGKLEDQEVALQSYFSGYNLIKIEKEPIVSLGQIDGCWNVVVPYLITIGQ